MKKLYFILITILTGTMVSCEKDITVDLPGLESKIVVEGSIENGQPPVILLSRNAPFFGELDLNNLESYLVSGANVEISDGDHTEVLVENCLNDFTPELRELIAGILGISLNEDGEFNINLCFYTVDFLGGSTFVGEVGKRYELRIDADGELLTATTEIPPLIPVDSIYARPHPDVDKDSLVRLWITYSDPDTLGNFARYFTKQNSEAYFPGINSVFDDAFINGETFDFPIDRGQSRTASFDFDTYGYFWKGDTIIYKWCTIDKDHYDFWRTLEFDAGAVGPFSSATLIETNIEGGLGIWGGYGCTYDTLIVSE